jgi:serine/threonine-protein kinase HipA
MTMAHAELPRREESLHDWEKAFLTLHRDMPRQGPGSDASTTKAIAKLPALPPSASVVDLGCGPGRQTLVLARTLRSRVVAIDICQQYLDQLVASAADAGLSDYVETRNMPMQALDHRPESLDLVWSEGALYTGGVSKMLRLLRPKLKTTGYVAFTEISWLMEAPPQEALDFWKPYPAMRDIRGNVATITGAGYAAFDHFTLPAADWWDEYYTPLLARVEALRPSCENGSPLAAVLDEAENEIDLYRLYGDSYGYVFYLCSRR